MQILFSFAVATGLLLPLSFAHANIVPAERNNFITLPLKRHVPAYDHLHPLVHHQMLVNHAHLRLARFTGGPAPTRDELEAKIRRRMLDVEPSGSTKKRFYPSRHRFSYPPRYSKRYRPYSPNADRSASNAFAGRDVLQLKPTPTAQAEAIGGPAAVAAAKTTALAIPGQPGRNDTLAMPFSLFGYFVTAEIGTPPKPFLLIVDSGSSDTWVNGEACTGPACHQVLSKASSSSLDVTKQLFAVTYGTGNVNGTVVKDDFALGPFKLSQHTFGVAQQLSDDFSVQATPSDGLLGLAGQVLSNQKTPTPIEVMKAQGLVKNAVVSYKLSRTSDDRQDAEITFGGLDQSKFNASTLQRLPSDASRTFWRTTMGTVTIDGKAVKLGGSRQAIFDTGTTLLLVPSSDAKAIVAAIPGARLASRGGTTSETELFVPCDTTAKMALTFGNVAYEIGPQDLALFQVSAQSKECVSGIAVADSFTATWLLGDTFLKNVYFSHNVDDNTISLAKLV